MPTVRELWERGQAGWPPGRPVVQAPNPPLLAALCGLALAAVTHGEVHDIGRAVLYTGLAAWAWLELADGAWWLRRVLGGAALVWIVARLAGEL